MREQVLCFPFLNKIQDYTLVLKNVVLNHGVCGAIKAVLQKIPNLVRHLYLDTNGLTGASTQLLMEGCLSQNGLLKTISLQDNELDPGSVDCLN